MPLTRRHLLGGLGLALMASYPVFIERYLVQVNEYALPVPHLPPAFEGYRIVHLTDIHLGLLVPPSFVADVVTTANDLRADLIVGTGDFVHHTGDEVKAVWPLLRRLGARDGVACVLGNHDYWADAEGSHAQLELSGFSLHHRARVVERRGQRLVLLGAGDATESEFGIERLLGQAQADDCRIVLAHNPDSMDLPRSGRVDLMLSGHTHGGQIRIPGVGAPVLPVRNKLYDQGIKRVEQSTLFISRGIGWAVAPARLACPPEIAVLTLVPLAQGAKV